MRVAALSCLLVALAASPVKGDTPASPLTFVGSLKTTSLLTWAQIQDGNGAVLILNSSSDLITVTTELRAVAEATEGAATLPVKLTESEAAIKSNEMHRFLIAADPQNPPQPGSYLAVVVLKDRSGKTQPVQQQFKITVPPLSPLVAKLTLYAWRLVPIGRCSPWNSLTAAIPLNHRYPISDSCSSLPVALRTDSGVIVTANYACSAGKTRELIIDKPWTTGKYEGDLTLGQYPEKIAVPLTIIAKDIVLYPIIVIALGTYLAFLAKRYLGVVRIAWGLREEEAELALAYRAGSQRFEKIAEGQPFSGLSIETDVGRQLAEVRQYATQLERGIATTISPTDPAYVNVLGDVQSLHAAFTAWPELAKTLLSLTEAVESVEDQMAQSDFRPDPPDEPRVVGAARQLMGQGEVTTAKIASLNEQASSLQALLEDWSNAFSKGLALRDAFSQLPNNGNYSDGQKELLKSLQQEFQMLPTQLWVVASAPDLAQLTGFSGTLNMIAGQLAQLKAEEPRLKAIEGFADAVRLVPSTSKVLSQYAWIMPGKTSALRLDADPARRVVQLKTAIWRSDWATTMFAGLIGLLTGLNTFYIGKPFGSPGDYLSLFLWAAGTKAVLDILLGVVDKFAPGFSK